jgi:magnesium transporter
MSEYQTEQLRDEVLVLLGEGQHEQALQVLELLLPADKAALFDTLPPELQEQLLPFVDPDDAADILEELDDDDAASLAESLSVDALVQVLDEMEPDEAADLLGDLEPALRLLTLESMEDADEVRSLLRYPDDSAGGLMTLEYYVFPDQELAGQVLRSIREQPRPDEEIPYIYAVDERERLTGVTRLADLIRAHPEQPLSSIARAEVVSVTAEEDQEVAARLMQRYDLMALPVLDALGRLVGVITADDAMAALEEEASEDLYKAAGILSLEGAEAARSDLLVRGPLWDTWKVRIPILVITLFGGFLAGAVIGAYEEELRTITMLAFFIPVVMDMGGSAGIQSTAVFIRGHALGQIDMQRFSAHLLRELGVGVGMGIILGALAGLVAALWQGFPELGMVVGLSLASTMTLAVMLGFLIPFLLLKLGLDPAAGSDPLITMIKDLTGLFIYFFFSTLFLGALL